MHAYSLALLYFRDFPLSFAAYRCHTALMILKLQPCAPSKLATWFSHACAFLLHICACEQSRNILSLYVSSQHEVSSLYRSYLLTYPCCALAVCSSNSLYIQNVIQWQHLYFSASASHLYCTCTWGMCSMSTCLEYFFIFLLTVPNQIFCGAQFCGLH